jgi:hypothetical protein
LGGKSAFRLELLHLGLIDRPGHQLEKMFEPKEHGELGGDLDAAIELAQSMDREACRLKCPDKQTMKNVLGWQTMHIKQLQKIRARIARSSD